MQAEHFQGMWGGDGEPTGLGRDSPAQAPAGGD